MPSREEFMRQMGISVDDVKDPTAVKTKFPSRASADAPLSERPFVPNNRDTSERVSAIPSSKMESIDAAVIKKKGYQAYADELQERNVVPSATPSQRAAPVSDARLEFLRSLGIDNMDVPPPGPAVVTSRASQEYVKPHRAAATASHDSLGSEEAGPGPRSFMSNPAPDITLGMRKSSLKRGDDSAPQLQAIDRELEGLTVDQIKNLGNDSFEQGDFRKAIRLYTRAIESDPRNGALYSNRSACYLQAAKQMGIDTRMMALRDADKVIELRPDWFKGYSRKGDALFKLEKFSEAAVAYERGLALDPENINLMHSLGEARNAAGGVPHMRAASWSTQPQSVENLRRASGKSAHELMQEMRDSLRQQSQDCIAVGNEYREQQLQHFRCQASTGRSSSSMKRNPYESEDRSDDSQVGQNPRSTSRLDSVRDDETFGSKAAAAYQQSLIEQYRRKKAAQSSSFTH